MARRVSLNELYFPEKESLRTMLLSFPIGEYREASIALLKLADTTANGLDKSFLAFNDNYQKAVRSVTSLSEEKSLMFQNNVSKLAAAKAEKFKKLKEKLPPDQLKALVKTFNRYQAAEYNAIVHRARVADQWETFQGERHLYPNIQWLRSRSASPREAHLVYAGRIWSMDDPFWTVNSPGCVWNCKCSWRTTDSPATDNSNVIPANSAPGLEGNPFITNELITAKHPYFERVQKHIPNVGVLNNPDEICYIPKVDANGNKFNVHYLALEEFKETNGRFLPFLIDAGYKDIRFLPVIDRGEIALRKRYYGSILSDSKCPDVMCDNTPVELKTIKNSGKKTRRNIIDQIGDAAHKADVAIIYIERVMNEEMLRKLANDRMTTYPNLKRILFIDTAKKVDCKRP